MTKTNKFLINKIPEGTELNVETLVGIAGGHFVPIFAEIGGTGSVSSTSMDDEIKIYNGRLASAPYSLKNKKKKLTNNESATSGGLWTWC